MASPWSRDLKLKPTGEIVFHSLTLAKGSWDNWDASRAGNDKHRECTKKLKLFLRVYDEARAKKHLPELCSKGHRRKNCPKGQENHFSNKDEGVRIRKLFDSCPRALDKSSDMQNYFSLIEVKMTDRVRHGKGENLPSYSYLDIETPPSPPPVPPLPPPIAAGGPLAPKYGESPEGDPALYGGVVHRHDEIPVDDATFATGITTWIGHETGEIVVQREPSSSDGRSDGGAEDYFGRFTNLDDYDFP
ncbi:MAG: hypothetical protein M1839_004513 [Geoglossum umbratile]|nr:MAG: hypothetical protein M1839_004513 [Geoglossum umbratile]